MRATFPVHPLHFITLVKKMSEVEMLRPFRAFFKYISLPFFLVHKNIPRYRFFHVYHPYKKIV